MSYSMRTATDARDARTLEQLEIMTIAVLTTK